MSANDLTYEKCLNWCAQNGYTLCGMEYSSECYGGNSLQNGAALSKGSSNSDMQCSGNQAQVCGGPSKLTLFAVPSAISSLNADLNGPAGGATSTQSSAGSQATGATGSIPSPWQAAGAIAEGINGRALTGGSISGSDMTYEKCLAWCSQQGFTICGMEYSSECYGDNQLRNAAALSRTSQRNTMPCSGNAQQICGGPDTLTLFVTPAAVSSLNADLNAPNGSAQTATGAAGSPTSAVSSAAGAASTSAPIPAGWSSLGGIAEGQGGRALTGGSTSAPDMTQAKCIAWCAQNGYALCGMEYSSECYGGNMLMNGAALSKLSPNADMMCSGDQTQPCGGSNKLTLFATQAAISSLNADLNAPLNGASTATSAAAGPAQSSAPAASGFQSPTLSSGWSIASTACIAEGPSGRALDADRTFGSDMTPQKCMDYCGSKGYAYSGVE
jgi:hypothetical protein